MQRIWTYSVIFNKHIMIYYCQPNFMMITDILQEGLLKTFSVNLCIYIFRNCASKLFLNIFNLKLCFVCFGLNNGLSPSWPAGLPSWSYFLSITVSCSHPPLFCTNTWDKRSLSKLLLSQLSAYSNDMSDSYKSTTCMASFMLNLFVFNPGVSISGIYYCSSFLAKNSSILKSRVICSFVNRFVHS